MVKTEVMTWEELDRRWPMLSEADKRRFFKQLIAEYKCLQCGGSLVIADGRTWVLHEITCIWRRYDTTRTAIAV
jgi:hypothetical protein